MVGDNNGKVWLYDVHESLANPRTDEWTRLTRTLNDIRQAAKETEELNQTLAEMNQTSTTSLPQTRNW